MFETQQTTKVYTNRQRVYLTYMSYCMGEIFQDLSWIQDFEADFP